VSTNKARIVVKDGERVKRKEKLSYADVSELFVVISGWWRTVAKIGGGGAEGS
jgi:hypothetical protein